ncbi:hypothetical protein T484DRAFT_1985875 [Baffinella frigidus]|nr:hypothetical protein T484DRAFT_1985875 [Cryptophyta sp. CCMP2293]
MGETHGPTQERGQALGRKFLSSISSFFSTVPSAHVVTAGAKSTSPGSSPTILRKLHRNKLPTSTSASPTVSSTPTVFSPVAELSRSPSWDVRSTSGTYVATVQPDISLPRSKSDSTASSTRRPPTPTPFQAGSHSPRDHLRGGCGCEEPVVPLMGSREAWKVMGRRFEQASPRELVPARRPLVFKARNLNRSVLLSGRRIPECLHQNTGGR